MHAFLLILCVVILCLPWSGATGAPGAVTEAGGLPGDMGRKLEEVCYTANLFDSFGDGWHGNMLTITDSGTGATVELTQSGSIAANIAESFSVCIDRCGSCFTGQVGGGSYTDETSWKIQDGAGETVAEASDRGSASFCVTCTTACEEGKQPNAEDNGCEACAAGKYSDTTGVALCTPCAAGSWSAVVGSSTSSDCVLCEAGKASGTPGASAILNCNTCTAGKYANAAIGASACSNCTAGSWSAVVGSSDCVLCEAGKASRVTGATSPNTCAECSEVSAASVPAGAALCDAALSNERAAVVAVLSNMPGWSDNSGDHCSWSGITCGSDGHVTRISNGGASMTNIAPE
jgi:hypothetical protein